MQSHDIMKHLLIIDLEFLSASPLLYELHTQILDRLLSSHQKSTYHYMVQMLEWLFPNQLMNHLCAYLLKRLMIPLVNPQVIKSPQLTHLLYIFSR